MTSEDTELQGHLARRDIQGAATCLVKRHADEVLGLCRAMVRDDAVAEDLSQDVFGRAFASLTSFRGDASSRTWILRIARNRCIDHLRSEQRRPWGSEEDVVAEDEAAPEPSVYDLLARHRDVRVGLETLEENERALVMLRFGHGLDYAELADAFGLREGACRMRVSRAIAKMRQALQPRLGGGVGASGGASAPRPAAPAAAAPLPRAAPASVPQRKSRRGTFGRGAPGAPPQAAPPSQRSAFASQASEALLGRLNDLVQSL